ncbi:MAG: helix-turn-helix transcriptional regulator [Candidatus Cloacimonetes bacterium]|nr:helix-turn-helix transcriptional regulator [Candidatus Cloacimonadota bacterium]
MTQQELASRVNVSRQTVHAIEKGKFNPSVKLALQIAEVFAVQVGEIFFLVEDGREREEKPGGAEK